MLLPSMDDALTENMLRKTLGKDWRPIMEAEDDDDGDAILGCFGESNLRKENALVEGTEVE